MTPPFVIYRSRSQTCLQALAVFDLLSKQWEGDASFLQSGTNTARRRIERGSAKLPREILQRYDPATFLIMTFSRRGFPVSHFPSRECRRRRVWAAPTDSSAPHREHFSSPWLQYLRSSARRWYFLKM